jgi:protein gp37
LAQNSRIEWTEATWNPVTGCSKISDGCQNCYAERLAHRLKAMGNKRYLNGFQVTLHHDLLDLPLRWKEPKMIFVNSMSDLFHEKVPVSFIKAVFKTMEKANWHTFQILTKRSKRLLKLAPKLPWPSNVWMGVTVEGEKYISRISDLQQVPATVKYLSIEPFITPISDLSTDGIDWVIVGGESGPTSRIMKADWVRSIRDKCLKEQIPFFFKQWGGKNKRKTGRRLDGRTWDNYPTKSLGNIGDDEISLFD